MKDLRKFQQPGSTMGQTAGQILGLIEAQEILKNETAKRIEIYSWDVSLEIAETLLDRLTGPETVTIKQYITKLLHFWVKNAITWASGCFVFQSTSQIEVPASDFKDLCVDKQYFVDCLNDYWHGYAMIEEWQADEKSVFFTFYLISELNPQS